MDPIAEMLTQLMTTLNSATLSGGGANPYYLPTVIKGQTNPVMEPFTAPNAWEFTNANDPGGSLSGIMNTICNNFYTSTQMASGALCDPGGGAPSFTLTLGLPGFPVTVVGLSNATVTRLDPTDESTTPIQATATVQMGSLGNEPGLQVSASPAGPGWSLAVCCCETPPGSSNCNGPCGSIGTATGTGVVDFQMDSASQTWPTLVMNFTILIDVSAPDGQKVQVGVSSINLNLVSGNLVPKVVVSSWGSLDQQTWQTTINQVMTSATFATYLEGALNQQLASSSVSSQLAQVLQTSANAFLQANNEYPYGNAPFARAF